MQLSQSNATESAVIGERYWQWPRLDHKNRVIGGVSSGVAEELGLDPLLVRIGFLFLLIAGGIGIALYACLWLVLAFKEFQQPVVRYQATAKGRSLRERQLGFAFLILGVASFSFNILGTRWFPFWASGFIALGLLSLRDGYMRRKTLRPKTFPQFMQVASGVALSLVGSVLLIAQISPTKDLVSLFPFLLVFLGLFVAVAPWGWRFLADFDQERHARIQSDMQADISAHLHDSVLQTLLLIQQNHADPTVVRNLARRQDRELRNWLDDTRSSRTSESMKGWLDSMANDVENLYGTPVEIVAVGDLLVTQQTETALQAAKEAAVNAAKHSRAQQIDVFAEVHPQKLELFIKDRGKGFDYAKATQDRQGIRHSIVGRIERIGGSANVVTSEKGTDIEIVVPLESTQ